MTEPMAWSKGRIVPIHEVKIPANDRTFEHGLGLFETLRSWNSHLSTFDMNLARMKSAANRWGIDLDSNLPDVHALMDLKFASGLDSDALFRITASGGTDSGSTVFVQAKPLPPAFPAGGLNIIVSRQKIDSNSPISSDKSLNYLARRLAHEEAAFEGANEALLTSPDGRIWEGSRSNLFLVKGESLLTPSLAAGPIVSGVMRELVIQVARSLDTEVRETDIRIDEVDSADEIFLTNCVRGVMPVASMRNSSYAALHESTIQRRITERLLDWLNSGRNLSWV